MIFLDPYGFENELSNLTIKLSKLCYFYHQIIFMVLSLFLHFAGLERLFFHTSNSRKDKRNGEEQTTSRWTKLTKNYNSEQKKKFFSKTTIFRKKRIVTKQTQHLNENS